MSRFDSRLDRWIEIVSYRFDVGSSGGRMLTDEAEWQQRSPYNLYMVTSVLANAALVGCLAGGAVAIGLYTAGEGAARKAARLARRERADD